MRSKTSGKRYQRKCDGKMPIRHYGILKGAATRRAFDREDRTPHYHLLVEAQGVSFHVAINVRSGLDGHDLLYAIENDFRHPVTELIVRLPPGFTHLPSLPNSGALDYVRGEVVDRARFRISPRL